MRAGARVLCLEPWLQTLRGKRRPEDVVRDTRARRPSDGCAVRWIQTSDDACIGPTEGARE
jgi:hypothetical protein